MMRGVLEVSHAPGTTAMAYPKDLGPSALSKRQCQAWSSKRGSLPETANCSCTCLMSAKVASSTVRDMKGEPRLSASRVQQPQLPSADTFRPSSCACVCILPSKVSRSAVCLGIEYVHLLRQSFSHPFIVRIAWRVCSTEPSA